MVGFRESIISMILVAVFAFTIIGFGAQFAIDNETNKSILNDPIINKSYGDIQTQLDSSSDSVETQKDSWYNDVPVIGAINLIWKSLTGILRVFFSTFTNLYNVIVTLISTTLGIPAIVLNAINVIITISILLLLWRLVRSGS